MTTLEMPKKIGVKKGYFKHALKKKTFILCQWLPRKSLVTQLLGICNALVRTRGVQPPCTWLSTCCDHRHQPSPTGPQVVRTHLWIGAIWTLLWNNWFTAQTAAHMAPWPDLGTTVHSQQLWCPKFDTNCVSRRGVFTMEVELVLPLG